MKITVAVATPLHIAASSGVVKIAEVMVDKNPHLPNVYDAMKPSPVLVAVAHKRRDMASFLFSNTNFEALNSYEQIELLIATISSDYYGIALQISLLYIALDILTKKPELAMARLCLEQGCKGCQDWR
ncbi:ankyrin repeat-containing protein [Cucumis melo var. makuwa]|uniref:Ankyrin repeat-containing protein n=1 Tax=Cucumis melo var. makuwa TaxID=1194695 RepID=A0A5A7UJS7_CUCMM|nr:ankyrin repeat-containing protein [Cucumis melo var. makuwa]